jgi:hypothetical protein
MHASRLVLSLPRTKLRDSLQPFNREPSMSLSFRASFLFTFLLLSGCGVPPAGVHQVGNWGPSMFLEDGHMASLYTKQLENYQGSRLYYDSRNSTYSDVMTENPTTWKTFRINDSDANDLWFNAPDWRREEKLIDAARFITADLPAKRERLLISSHQPFAVGITGNDTQYGDPFYNFNLFLGASEFNTAARARMGSPMITTIYVSAELPRSPSDQNNRRIYILNPPKKIEDVMNDPSWEHPDPDPPLRLVPNSVPGQ